MTEKEQIDLIVQLRDSGKVWWEISQQAKISPEMCRYRYRQAKNLLKPKNQEMDLRDYFAANAPINFETLDEYWGIHWKLCDNLDANDYLAKARYEYADAMMKAREQ